MPEIPARPFTRLSFEDSGLGFLTSSRRYVYAEYIGENKQTQGTETSKYLEERTSTETPLVVASERGPGQCFCKNNRNHLERWAVAGDSPVRVMSSSSLE
jgi:hypothetical protein